MGQGLFFVSFIMQDYHDLTVWKEAFTLARCVYGVALTFPKYERYGMSDQLRRCSLSVVANIVEGRGKATDKDFRKFLYIANGSLDEMRCILELAVAVGYLKKEEFQRIDLQRERVGKLLYGLIKSLH